MDKSAEATRLEEARVQGLPWRKWGPYLSERQWGTVREDYSEVGDAWNYFTHDHAHSRTYRWGEDGLAGISDDKQRLCFALALWNGEDPILKERLFGLTNSEGNHGEDVKEYYFYLDSTPTHSYMKYLYKYPQAAYPYADLVETNRRRSKNDMEYELIDTGIFNDDRYFDVFVEYAKDGPEDILVRITAVNRGPDAAELHLLPTLWFRNDWSAWIAASNRAAEKPILEQIETVAGMSAIAVKHPLLGKYIFSCEGDVPLLFTENETNHELLFPGQMNESLHVKDGINNCVVQGNKGAVNPEKKGTKVAAHYKTNVGGGQTKVICLRLSSSSADQQGKSFGKQFDEVFADRLREADEFYKSVTPPSVDEDAAKVMRQALAGMLWSKQFFFFDGDNWLDEHHSNPLHHGYRNSQNSEWFHMLNQDIISMPDKWEYPWYAAWDLAFHTIALSLVDPDFAKEQLILLLREWYMHPNGQLPAYEWAFGDVNPPVHAWAAWRVYEIDREQRGGEGDWDFLERVFHKLMLNFTWWVNRKDVEGRNIFQGGFLGLDNIGIFDRNAALPSGGYINQADGTAWMAMYTLNLMRIALELALTDHVYEDIASKFFEHFLYIAEAMTNIGGDGIGLWDEQDEFYYDVLHLPGGERIPLRVRSLVGLIPLFAVEVLDASVFARLPSFSTRAHWFLEHRPQLARLVSRWHDASTGERHLLSLLRGHRMKRLLNRMLDETAFLSEFGVRSLSKFYRENPYVLARAGHRFEVRYITGASDSGVFGGNSNWRGPIWMPVNFLIIESLQRFHSYYVDEFKVECPVGSGRLAHLGEVADELSRRLCRIFLRDENGRRPVLGQSPIEQEDIHFRDNVLFYEYFHGDTGRGLGAAHQTGWTALIALLLRSHSSADAAQTGVQEATGRAPALAQ